jgi:hypothetical protein
VCVCVCERERERERERVVKLVGFAQDGLLNQSKPRLLFIMNS